jgi:HSP20 family protein
LEIRPTVKSITNFRAVAKDIDVSVLGGDLIIKGERTCERKEDGYDTRSYGRFEQRVTLPTPVDADKVEAMLANDVLCITLPKCEEAKPRKIAVKSK